MTNTMHIFQDAIIAEITKAVGVQPIMGETQYGSPKAIWPLTPLAAPDAKGRTAYTPAFQIRFEDDVVAYLEMGSYSMMHGFYDDGTTATLSNVGISAVAITAKALLGEFLN